MYPDRKLIRLAAHKAALRRDIALRRAQCVVAAARIARPLAWLDRVMIFWRRLSPFAQLASVPLGFLVQRAALPRRGILGLAVVHGIMDSHDGAVTVHSQPGEGTSFRLYFPEYVGEATPGRSEAGPTPRGQGDRVLVVDDEEMLAELGANLLTRLGYTAESTTTSAQALELVRADPSHFALVLTDQTMPRMTGLQLASQLRDIRPDLPIILMTGYNLSLTTDRIGASGIGNILQKPFTLHSLGTAVHAIMTGKFHPPHGTNSPY